MMGPEPLGPGAITVTPPAPRCKRCMRTDMPLLTNGLCARCDDALYNYHYVPMPGSVAPPGWPEPGYVTVCDEKGRDINAKG